MRKSLLRFANFVDRLNEPLWYFGYAIVIMTFIVVFEIVARDVFKAPTVWAWGVNRQLLCFMAIIGGGYTLLHRHHVSMDMLYHRWSGRTRAMVELFTAFLPLIWCGALVWIGGELAWRAIIRHEAFPAHLFHVPYSPLKLAFVIGIFLLLLQVVAQFIRNLLTIITQRVQR